MEEESTFASVLLIKWWWFQTQLKLINTPPKWALPHRAACGWKTQEQTVKTSNRFVCWTSAHAAENRQKQSIKQRRQAKPQLYVSCRCKCPSASCFDSAEETFRSNKSSISTPDPVLVLLHWSQKPEDLCHFLTWSLCTKSLFGHKSMVLRNQAQIYFRCFAWSSCRVSVQKIILFLCSTFSLMFIVQSFIHKQA